VRSWFVALWDSFRIAFARDGADCTGRVCYSNRDSSDFGINVESDGLLHGLAWGENIGWINFDTASLGDVISLIALNLIRAAIGAAVPAFVVFRLVRNSLRLELPKELISLGFRVCVGCGCNLHALQAPRCPECDVAAPADQSLIAP
jgi:hypothetical protein